jgi:ATP/maltotriose-dependent transcriptional regulator MalT
MYSIAICGPQIYRNAVLDQVRLGRTDIRIAAISNHLEDAPAMIANSIPDAALVISAVSSETMLIQAERIRKVDLDVRLIWWKLSAEEITNQRLFNDFEMKIVDWQAAPDTLVVSLGIPALSKPSSPNRPHLTNQEHHILQLAADGLSNRGIAFRLSVSESTVKNHLRHIGAKFNTSSRAQAVWQAVQWGYLSPQENNQTNQLTKNQLTS